MAHGISIHTVIYAFLAKPHVLFEVVTVCISCSSYPAFVHVDEQDTRYPGGSGRLQLQPSVRTIQAAVEPLFKEPGLSQYSVISISQLLTRSVVASANVAGMAVSPVSVFPCTEPAVVSSAKHFGFHFTRRLAHLRASDFSATSNDQKVLIAYLGQTPCKRRRGRPRLLLSGLDAHCEHRSQARCREDDFCWIRAASCVLMDRLASYPCAIR